MEARPLQDLLLPVGYPRPEPKTHRLSSSPSLRSLPGSPWCEPVAQQGTSGGASTTLEVGSWSIEKTCSGAVVDEAFECGPIEHADEALDDDPRHADLLVLEESLLALTSGSDIAGLSPDVN